ncbi:Dihydroorotate dehydrogenase (quinone) [Seminavis robusta]|uniref:Dihydroorotate dehydrogenase (quinone), mitochondrial n=1 Tax=Seminavis robusta TaxID=568900 RepID=A0A9N8H9Y0_9STRA|nr:Dihydroorotate dehydrogenase (quinone) [Seminavis robusta]|eukprot:Sro271_g104640.1 Dihydroorotate dehydrogenase (quinone) (456) ;mRNA; f:61032-62611
MLRQGFRSLRTLTGKSSEIYHRVSDQVVTPLLRRYLDPEVAHNVALDFARKGFALRHRPSPMEDRVNVKISMSFDTTIHESNGDNNSSNSNNENKRFALQFPNPIGLAAGFDKDGEAIQPLMDMGFGFVEIGTVTPKPQPGNPKPRMFRLADDLGIINRYGFNSKGADAVEENVKAFRQTQLRESSELESKDGSSIMSFQSIATAVFPTPKPAQGLLGINIGKNKTTEDAKTDYVKNILQLGSYADYLVINISSPNTPNLRDLQKAQAMGELIQACLEARKRLSKPVPLLVKLSPDLTTEELKSMVPVLRLVDGVVVTNTTNQRPKELVSKHHVEEMGGLSGAPIKDKSTEVIRQLYKEMNGNVFIVGVGGIGSGEDAYEKLKAGASVVQLYSLMVYDGPGCVSRIRHDLATIMDQRGHKCLEDIIGRDHEEIFWRKQQERHEMSLSKENTMIVE